MKNRYQKQRAVMLEAHNLFRDGVYETFSECLRQAWENVKNHQENGRVYYTVGALEGKDWIEINKSGTGYNVRAKQDPRNPKLGFDPRVKSPDDQIIYDILIELGEKQKSQFKKSIYIDLYLTREVILIIYKSLKIKFKYDNDFTDYIEGELRARDHSIEIEKIKERKEKELEYLLSA